MVPADPLDSGFSDVKLTVFTLHPLLYEGICAPKKPVWGVNKEGCAFGWASQALECGTQSLPGCLQYNLLRISSQPPNPSLPPRAEVSDQAWSGNQVDVFIPFCKAGPKFPVL